VTQMTQMGQTPPMGYGTPSPVPVPVPAYYNPDANQGYMSPGAGQSGPGQQHHHEMAATPLPFVATLHQQQERQQQQHSPPPMQHHYQSSSPPPQQQQYQYPRPPSPAMGGSPTSSGFSQQNLGQQQLPQEMPAIYSPQPGMQGQGQYGQYGQQQR
jgi:hypothetical protein